MQFNMFQYSMRLNKLNNIGLVTGLGLEYQRFRFANKNSIKRGDGGQIYPMEVENVKKSFSGRPFLPDRTSYLRMAIPSQEIPTCLRGSRSGRFKVTAKTESFSRMKTVIPVA